MRIVVTTVLTASFALGGLAAAQGPGAPRATARSAYMVEPFAPAAPITIQGTGVRLRAEPFTGNDSQVLSTGSTGLQLNVIGLARQADWNWYQVILKNGQKAFIRSDLTSAPMRGDATSTYVAPIQPIGPPPQVAYTPPPTPQPAWTPPAQPTPNTGAISLTPAGGSTQLDLPRPQAAPAPAPVDNGLITVAPSAPVPRLSDPVGATTGAYSPAISTAGDAAQQIRAQLDAKRCWTDSGNMMDAQRLRASFGVTFAPNGKFASEPRLITPAAEPSDDPAMMVFLAKARAALRTCNALGFDMPAGGASGELKLDFSAR